MRSQRMALHQSKEINASATIREALSFDVRPAHDDGEAMIAEQRVQQLGHIPLLLGLTHLFGFVHYFIEGVSRDPRLHLAILIGLLCADIIALGVLLFQRRISLAPSRAIQLLGAYAAFCAAGWAYLATCVFHDLNGGSPLVAAIVIGGGVVAMAIAAIGAPALAILMGLSATVSAAVFKVDEVVILGLSLTIIVVTAYATFSARTMIATARRRLILDREAHQALRFVTEFESSGRGWFWETDATGTLSYVSRQLAEDFDCDPSDLLGRRFTDLLSIDTATDEEHLREERTLGFHLSARFPFADVVVRAARDEDVLWSLSGNPIFNENGKFIGFRGIGADLTEQRRNEQEISRLARFDSLTSLPNRAMMRQTLDEALRNAARRQKGCALFLIDLDRFKNVNDTLGHPVGDKLLRQVAQRLTRVLGNHGQVGRLGGDEFKAVLPGAVETGLLERLATLMIEQVSQPYQIEGHRVTIGASIGIAIGDPGRACADSLTRNADLALYAAKAAGRGKHCFFEPSMHSEATDRQRLENDLRGALERHELEVHYQPIVRASCEDLIGFEALVRWIHPVRGPISPDLFISIAEECGLIGRLGDFVLETAIATAAQWPENIRIAVNLSPIQFNDPKICEKIATLLTANGMRAERLELEITEGVFLAEGQATDETFQRLKNIGVRLALDDFGTGYSSLGYLKTAPFDKIKIDQSFVRGASNPHSRNSAIIRAIVALAESLGMDTTAEGVETHDDLNLIRELGCSQVQGYIFGKPCNADRAFEMVKRASVSPEGHQNTREPRHRLMRRGLIMLNNQPVEIRLRNISAMGALIECSVPVAPGTELTIDIIGTGPVVGTVRWAQAGRFGVQFDETFNLTRLAPPRKKSPGIEPLNSPFYVDRRTG
ncbi:EAL domain-containing protein [Sphingomicrobium astaxanthinifaciens]|uniref:EAL domain-containing protein n=1 Tax=Sphingomicrobium astaxanthinifaciens TaxID=1227949 RepID=UPI001FCBA181|nr:EAL domain-containing protein [Sphingomicrobium astaxanthinifaciens]MCJ7420637.1 EAL domain-containing protein [Sphingomicrobium astaxanthinifaciens]